MTHDNDREQLADLHAQRARDRLAAIAPKDDATIEHRGIDTIAYLQERIRELRKENSAMRDLIIAVARRPYTIVVSTQEMHMPLADWDAFRDYAYRLSKGHADE